MQFIMSKTFANYGHREKVKAHNRLNYISVSIKNELFSSTKSLLNWLFPHEEIESK